MKNNVSSWKRRGELKQADSSLSKLKFSQGDLANFPQTLHGRGGIILLIQKVTVLG